MKVLLVRPPIWYVDLSPGPFSLGFYTAFMTRYPPLGLLYVAGALRAAGHEARLVDAEAEELEAPSLRARVGSFAPGLIVGNVNVYDSRRNLDDLVALKQGVGGVLAVRGHFPRHYPDECAGEAGVDVTFTGKGQVAAVALADVLAEGGDLAGVPGVRHRKGGAVAASPHAEPPEDLDALPFPPRDLLDHRLYSTNLSYRRPFTTMFGSSGCPYECTYCQDHNLRYRPRRVEGVLAEVEECATRHGIREIAFLDPTFTVRRGWAEAFCDGLAALRLDLTFTMRTRPDLVDADLLARLRRAGCVRISYGIESADPGILANLNRRVAVEATIAAVAEAERLGIMTFGYFMLGNKGETAESLGRTMDLVRRLPLHFAQFFETIPLPGTEALADTKRALGFDPWREIHAGRCPPPSAFLPQDIRLSHAELRRWSRRFYAEMYFNPRRWPKLLWMKYLPAYVLRQVDIAALVLRLRLLRRLRRFAPAFRVAPLARATVPGPRA